MQTVPADPLLKAVTDGADDDDDVGYWAGSDRTVHIYIYIYTTCICFWPTLVLRHCALERYAWCKLSKPKNIYTHDMRKCCLAAF